MRAVLYENFIENKNTREKVRNDKIVEIILKIKLREVKNLVSLNFAKRREVTGL